MHTSAKHDQTLPRRSKFRWVPLLFSVSIALGAVSGGAYWWWVAPIEMTLEEAFKKPPPTRVEEAVQRVQRGERWTARQIRWVYVQRARSIHAKNAAWEREGLPIQERAQRAFAERKEARMVARAMMADPIQVEALEERDRVKYGSPHGPTWEYLISKGHKKGKKGDALFAWIIDSAQRTNRAVTRSIFKD